MPVPVCIIRLRIVAPQMHAAAFSSFQGCGDPFRGDGTPTGTDMLDRPADVGIHFSPGPPVRVGDRIYFSAGDPTHGRELWLLEPAESDANFDGDVDLEDLNHVRNNFGRTRGNIKGDVTNDDVVGLADLNEVRNNFGEVPSPTATTLMRRHAIDHIFAQFANGYSKSAVRTRAIHSSTPRFCG